MEIRLLSAEQVTEYWLPLYRLMECCMEASFSDPVPTGFIAGKLNDLREYLWENRAYLFAALDEGDMRGFLWACELASPFGRKFHVLYFAVLPEAQGQGFGGKLLCAAESKARELGIPRMELIVSIQNASAVGFYHSQRYEEERVILKKQLEEGC